MPVKWLVLAIVLAACEKSQSAKDGMQALCDAQFMNATPAEHRVLMDKWVKDHVRNAQIRDLYAAVQGVPADVRRAKLREEARKLSIEDCAIARDSFHDHLPTVTGPGIENVEEGGPMIVVTTSGIVVDGRSIASISNGAVDPADLEGGALGVKIARLAAYFQNLPNRDKRVLIAMDKTLPYRLLYQILYSVKTTGAPSFGVIGTKDGSEVMLPLTLPDKARSAVAVVGQPDGDDGMVVAIDSPPPANMPLQMIVTVTSLGELRLWSISALEGSIKEPKLMRAVKDAGPEVQAALAEIVARRFTGKPRSERDRQIIAMFDANVPMQTVLEALANLRRTQQGTELFPDVLLSSGFE